MIHFPPCKINLGLNILRKRPDGFHDIETGFVPVPWTDILEIIPSGELVFTSSGAEIPGDADDNLCMKAYQLLNKDFNIGPVQIHLHKIIPTGAGLGGGSSDAAYTLRLLNEIFKLNLTAEKLGVYAAKLGSDCAFFIQDKPMLGTARGEILTDMNIDLHGKFLVIIKPEIHVSTVAAYADVQPAMPTIGLRSILENHPLKAWKELLNNNFETSVFKRFPVIGEIKETLYAQGAIYASMSGSGASVFGIFEKEFDTKNLFKGHLMWRGFF